MRNHQFNDKTFDKIAKFPNYYIRSNKAKGTKSSKGIRSRNDFKMYFSINGLLVGAHDL